MSLRAIFSELLLILMVVLATGPVAAQTVSPTEEDTRRAAEAAAERTCSIPINMQSKMCRDREKTLYNACILKYQASPSEGDVVFAEQMCSNVKEEAAFMARAALPIIKEAHAAAANSRFELAFKGLRIGSEFKFQDMPNEQGDGAIVIGLSNRGVENGSRYGICAKGECGAGRDSGRIRWKCSVEQMPTFLLACEIDTPGKFATAFGAKLEQVRVELMSPSFLNYLSLGDAGSITWRISSIAITSADKSMFQPAREYLQAATKTQAKARQGQRPLLDSGGITPSKERCASVMNKKIANLTSADIELKKQCSNSLTALAQAEVKDNALDFGDCCILTRTESGFGSVVTMTLNSPEISTAFNSPKAKASLAAARKELESKESKRKNNDF